jgi:hypothetical protein
MRRSFLLMATALGEGATGLLLVIWPSLLMLLLLGTEQAALETLVLARIAGAALLAFSIVCWTGRSRERDSRQRGLLVAVLFYDVAAAVILAYAGGFMDCAGIALWPAVAIHLALAGWATAEVFVERR